VVQATKPKIGPVAAPTEGAAQIVKAARSFTVSIFDNAFHAGQDRPAIHLQAGGTLTWRWVSQQSHQVTLRSGPQLAPSPTKTAGEYSAKLEAPGTYTFVCSIHAPGMRMTAIVE
jgi:plastocyanin